MTKICRLKIFFLFVVGITFGCYTKTKPTNQVETSNPSLTFSFDTRVETTYIVLMLTGKYDFLISQQPTTYKHQAEKYFEAYKDHKAVKLASGLIDEGFSFDYAASWICQFSEFPGFQVVNKVDFPFNDSTLNGGRTIDTAALAEFQQNLILFYKEAGCDSFFYSQKEFILNMLVNTIISVSKNNLPSIIEDYYGIHKNASFQVILSPLLHSGGFEVDCINKKNHQLSLIAMIGPNGELNHSPVFDNDFLEKDLIIHEFGHSYENDIVEQFLPQTLQYEKILLPPVKSLVENEGCSNWRTFMHELIDRAVTLRIVQQVYGKEAAGQLLEYERSVGFKYVEEIAEELKIYEDQREKYPTLKDFFHRVIKRLGTIQK